MCRTAEARPKRRKAKQATKRARDIKPDSSSDNSDSKMSRLNSIVQEMLASKIAKAAMKAPRRRKKCEGDTESYDRGSSIFLLMR